MQVPLHTLVPVANYQGACYDSPERVLDDFVSASGVEEEIVGISTVRIGSTVVGFLYRTQSGRFFAQALRRMPREARARIDALDFTRFAGPNAGSGFTRIMSNPWPQYEIVPCTGANH